MITLQQIALHARVVENRIRREFPHYSPIMEIELSPKGFIVKAIGGDDDKAFQERVIVDFDDIDMKLRDSVDIVANSMCRKMGAPCV